MDAFTLELKSIEKAFGVLYVSVSVAIEEGEEK